MDTGVNRTLILEKVWKTSDCIKVRDLKLKKNKHKFVLFGTHGRLECIGRSKVILEVEAGSQIKTMVYVI